MPALQAIDRALFGLVSFLAQLLLWLAVAMGFFQVVARFVLHSPLDWSEVLTRAAIIWVVMLGTALAFRSGTAIAVQFLHSRLRGPARRWLEHLIGATCVGFLLFLAWIGAQITYRVRFQSLAGLEISISWVYLAIPVGAALSALAVLLHWLMAPQASATSAEPAPL
ncbi:TRAP transporter small permease [Comamonadaceae bacterium OH2310_COT-174]|nr:TRAP transporter small permease [Comamonadaceae bacterium OH2310_COT-174]